MGWIARLNQWIVKQLADAAEVSSCLLLSITVSAVLAVNTVALVVFIIRVQIDPINADGDREFTVIAWLSGFVLGYIVSAFTWFEMGERKQKKRVTPRGSNPPDTADDYRI